MKQRRFFRAGSESSRSLHKRLIRMMAILLMILLIFLVGGLFLFHQISIPGAVAANELYLQEKFFTSSMENYWSNLAVMTIDFSNETSADIEQTLKKENLSIGELAYRNENSTALEGKLLPVLIQRLSQVQCSGGYIIFHNEDGKETVPGIYLKKDIYHISNPEIIMYRGAASAADQSGITLHNKWHMEISFSSFPNYQKYLKSAETAETDKDVHLSDMFVLPGTDENVVLITCPLKSSEGKVYGLCGFEVSERYFRYLNEQATLLSRLICMVTPVTDGDLNAEKALHCGFQYVRPTSLLNVKSIGNHLLGFTNDEQEYVGVQENINISYANAELTLTVMIPKRDYDEEVHNSIRQAAILIVLIVFMAVICCWYFGERYLNPIRKSLKYMKEKNYADAKVNIDELDDLSSFMQEQSDIHQEQVSSLTKDRLRAQAEVSRLAYERKKEVDPAVYDHFKEGLKTLTAAERQILSMIGDGKKTKEILAQLSISENTLKFHLRNIYSKLDVHSRKEASLYLNIYRKERQEMAKGL